tara:strand:+ start:356 stop:1264 length:909 start_codon:yes stop_codon:yes gene_type:complete
MRDELKYGSALSKFSHETDDAPTTDAPTTEPPAPPPDARKDPSGVSVGVEAPPTGPGSSADPPWTLGPAVPSDSLVSRVADLNVGTTPAISSSRLLGTILKKFPEVYKERGVELFNKRSLADFPYDKKMEVTDEAFEMYMKNVCHVTANVFMKYCMEELERNRVETRAIRSFTGKKLFRMKHQLIALLRQQGVYRLLASARKDKTYTDDLGEECSVEAPMHDFVLVVCSAQECFLVQTNIYEPTKGVDIRQIEPVYSLLTLEGLRSTGLGILADDEEPHPRIHQLGGFQILQKSRDEQGLGA